MKTRPDRPSTSLSADIQPGPLRDSLNSDRESLQELLGTAQAKGQNPMVQDSFRGDSSPVDNLQLLKTLIDARIDDTVDDVAESGSGGDPEIKEVVKTDLLDALLNDSNQPSTDQAKGQNPMVQDSFREAPSFLEQQQFGKLGDPEQNKLVPAIDASGPTTLQDMIETVDLRVETARPIDGKPKVTDDDSPFALYTPDPERTIGKMDSVSKRTLHEMESGIADFVDVLDKSANIVRANPTSSLIPLTQAYTDLAQFEKSMIETGRKMFGSGANFTEFEIRNILDQIGPFFGVDAIIRGAPILLDADERVERLEKAQDLFMSKVDKRYESFGFKRKRVHVTGPDGQTIEVDAFEAPRANRLAQDPQKWAQFVQSLKKGK